MLTTKAVTATLLAVVLVLGACGSDDDVTAGSGGTTTTTVSGLDGIDAAPDGTGVTVPDREPDLVGTITVITPFVPVTEDCIPPEDVDPDAVTSSYDPPVCTPADSNVIGTILVEEDLRPEQGRKISFTVTTDTKLTGVTADGVKVGVFAGLAEGQTVDTWVTGPCAESYPEQCTADAIRVTG
jgi:hypothetical protein